MCFYDVSFEWSASVAAQILSVYSFVIIDGLKLHAGFDSTKCV
jgi:hypothetical protein